MPCSSSSTRLSTKPSGRSRRVCGGSHRSRFPNRPPTGQSCNRRPATEGDGYVRGGLDDALEKLARRDELRRRATGEATGTSPAVTELVEAVAAVVAHHPELGVSVGVEGAGDPMLLHFYF